MMLNAKTPGKYFVILFLCAILSGVSDAHADSRVKEYQVKAGFLFNFFNFVNWPVAAPVQTDNPVRLGIVADGHAGKIIEEHIKGRTVLDRRLEIIRSDNIADLATCRMIFISASRAGLSRRIVSALKEKSILTVSETRDFVADGGMINFITENNKIRLQINQTAADLANLKISSKLLRVAKTVIRDEVGERHL